MKLRKKQASKKLCKNPDEEFWITSEQKIAKILELRLYTNSLFSDLENIVFLKWITQFHELLLKVNSALRKIEISGKENQRSLVLLPIFDNVTDTKIKESEKVEILKGPYKNRIGIVKKMEGSNITVILKIFGDTITEIFDKKDLKFLNKKLKTKTEILSTAEIIDSIKRSSDKIIARSKRESDFIKSINFTLLRDAVLILGNITAAWNRYIKS